MVNQDGGALDPTLAQVGSSPSAPELVDVGARVLDEPGSIRYETGDLLGEGGMGEVRVCRDKRIGRRIAMKRLKNGIGSRSDARARFLREARVQGQLEHPAVVPVYDLGRTPDGVDFFTMKRVRGQTLASVLAEGKLTQRKLLTAYSSVCLAIHYAHTRGVLHRDLKPANLMLGDFGEVYVLDWGLAKVTGTPDPTLDEKADTPSPDGLTTQAGSLLGTPGYIAPEVLEGGEPSPTSDVYALGAILYEILAGKTLHEGNGEQRVASTLAGGERRPERVAPPELVELCVRATSRDPASRLASARELHEAVERYLDGDRDLGLRRDAALRHTTASQAALGRGDRPVALRELGTAIALDPTNDDAKAGLVALLTTPPEDPPPEASVEIERYEDAALRTSARVATMAYGAYFLFFPLSFWLGWKNGWYVGASIVIFALAVWTSWMASRASQPGPLLRYGTLVTTCAALASLSMLWGPYLGVPALLGLNAMGFAARPRRFKIWAVALANALAIVVPVALELAGVLPRAYAYSGDQVHVFARAVHFPGEATAIVLFITQVAIVLAAVIYSAQTQGVTGEVERRLHLHLWQLRQLVPEGAAPLTPAPEDKTHHCTIL